MAEQGYMLSEQAVKKLSETVRRLEGEVRHMRQRLEDSQRIVQQAPQLYWGITSKRNDTNYPNSAAVAPGGYNVYWVELADVSFTLADAATLKDGLDSDITTQSQASNFVQACSLTNVPIPEGTRVVVERQWSTDGWRYWIRPNWTTMYRATASEQIDPGDNGQVACKDAGGTTIMTVTAYYTWMSTGASSIANGDELLVAWFEVDNRWYIIGREC